MFEANLHRTIFFSRKALVGGKFNIFTQVMFYQDISLHWKLEMTVSFLFSELRVNE